MANFDSMFLSDLSAAKDQKRMSETDQQELANYLSLSFQSGKTSTDPINADLRFLQSMTGRSDIVTLGDLRTALVDANMLSATIFNEKKATANGRMSDRVSNAWLTMHESVTGYDASQGPFSAHMQRALLSGLGASKKEEKFTGGTFDENYSGLQQVANQFAGRQDDTPGFQQNDMFANPSTSYGERFGQVTGLLNNIFNSADFGDRYNNPGAQSVLPGMLMNAFGGSVTGTAYADAFDKNASESSHFYNSLPGLVSNDIPSPFLTVGGKPFINADGSPNDTSVMGGFKPGTRNTQYALTSGAKAFVKGNGGLDAFEMAPRFGSEDASRFQGFMSTFYAGGGREKDLTANQRNVVKWARGLEGNLGGLGKVGGDEYVFGDLNSFTPAQDIGVFRTVGMEAAHERFRVSQSSYFGSGAMDIPSIFTPNPVTETRGASNFGELLGVSAVSVPSNPRMINNLPVRPQLPSQRTPGNKLGLSDSSRSILDRGALQSLNRNEERFSGIRDNSLFAIPAAPVFRNDDVIHSSEWSKASSMFDEYDDGAELGGFLGTTDELFTEHAEMDEETAYDLALNAGPRSTRQILSSPEELSIRNQTLNTATNNKAMSAWHQHEVNENTVDISDYTRIGKSNAVARSLLEDASKGISDKANRFNRNKKYITNLSSLAKKRGIDLDAMAGLYNKAVKEITPQTLDEFGGTLPIYQGYKGAAERNKLIKGALAGTQFEIPLPNGVDAQGIMELGRVGKLLAYNKPRVDYVSALNAGISSSLSARTSIVNGSVYGVRANKTIAILRDRALALASSPEEKKKIADRYGKLQARYPASMSGKKHPGIAKRDQEFAEDMGPSTSKAHEMIKNAKSLFGEAIPTPETEDAIMEQNPDDLDDIGVSEEEMAAFNAQNDDILAQVGAGDEYIPSEAEVAANSPKDAEWYADNNIPGEGDGLEEPEAHRVARLAKASTKKGLPTYQNVGIEASNPVWSGKYSSWDPEKGYGKFTPFVPKRADALTAFGTALSTPDYAGKHYGKDKKNVSKWLKYVNGMEPEARDSFLTAHSTYTAYALHNPADMMEDFKDMAEDAGANYYSKGLKEPSVNKQVATIRKIAAERGEVLPTPYASAASSPVDAPVPAPAQIAAPVTPPARSAMALGSSTLGNTVLASTPKVRTPSVNPATGLPRLDVSDPGAAASPAVQAKRLAASSTGSGNVNSGGTTPPPPPIDPGGTTASWPDDDNDFNQGGDPTPAPNHVPGGERYSGNEAVQRIIGSFGRQTASSFRGASHEIYGDYKAGSFFNKNGDETITPEILSKSATLHNMAMQMAAEPGDYDKMNPEEVAATFAKRVTGALNVMVGKIADTISKDDPSRLQEGQEIQDKVRAMTYMLKSKTTGYAAQTLAGARDDFNSNEAQNGMKVGNKEQYDHYAKNDPGFSKRFSEADVNGPEQAGQTAEGNWYTVGQSAYMNSRGSGGSKWAQNAQSIYRTDFGKMMMGLFMGQRAWTLMGDPVMKASTAYATEQSSFALGSLAGGETPTAAMTSMARRDEAVQTSGQLAYEKFGMFQEAGFMFGGGAIGNAVTSVGQTLGVATGAGVAVGATMFGLGALGTSAAGSGLLGGAAAAGLTAVGGAALGAGLGVAGAIAAPLLAMDIGNILTGDTPSSGFSPLNLIRKQVMQNYDNVSDNGMGASYIPLRGAGIQEIAEYQSPTGKSDAAYWQSRMSDATNEMFPNLGIALSQSDETDFLKLAKATDIPGLTAKQKAPMVQSASYLGGGDTDWAQKFAQGMQGGAGYDSNATRLAQIGSSRGYLAGSSEMKALGDQMMGMVVGGNDLALQQFSLDSAKASQRYSQIAPYVGGMGNAYEMYGSNDWMQSASGAQVAARGFQLGEMSGLASDDVLGYVAGGTDEMRFTSKAYTVADEISRIGAMPGMKPKDTSTVFELANQADTYGWNYLEAAGSIAQTTSDVGIVGTQQISQFASMMATQGGDYQQSFKQIEALIKSGDISSVQASRMASGDQQAWSDYGRTAGIGSLQMLDANGFQAGKRDYSGILLDFQTTNGMSTSTSQANSFATFDAMGIYKGDTEMQGVLLKEGMDGGSRLHANRMFDNQMAGIGLGYAQIQSSMNFMWGDNAGGTATTPTANSQWGLQDQMSSMQFSSQMASFAATEKRMKTTHAFEEENQQASETRWGEGVSFNRWSSGFDYQTSQMQRGFAREDQQYSTQMTNLSHDWSTSDLNEQIRRSSGRDRELLIQKKDREGVAFNMQTSQTDKQNKRQEELWAREDQRYEKQIEHTETIVKMDEDDFARQIEQRDVLYKMDVDELKRKIAEAKAMYALQQEMVTLQREQAVVQMEFQKKSLALQAQAAIEQKLYAEAQEKTGTALGNLVTAFGQLVRSAPAISSMIGKLANIHVDYTIDIHENWIP